MATRSTIHEMFCIALRAILEPKLFSQDPIRSWRRLFAKLRTISGRSTPCLFIHLLQSMTTHTTRFGSPCAAGDTPCEPARVTALRRLFYVRLNRANPNPAPISSAPAMHSRSSRNAGSLRPRPFGRLPFAKRRFGPWLSQVAAIVNQPFALRE